MVIQLTVKCKSGNLEIQRNTIAILTPCFTSLPDCIKEREIGYLFICEGAASHVRCSGILYSEELSRLLHSKAPSVHH
jgi:hypothetical protein